VIYNYNYYIIKMGNNLVSKENEEALTFSKAELKVLYKNFIELDTDKSGLLEPNELMDVPELSDNPIVKRVIQVFDKNNDGKISFYEFILGLSTLADFTEKEEKTKFAFQVYDVNGDGFLSNSDLFHTLKLLTGDNLSDVQIQQVVDRTMLRADKDYDGRISFDEFQEFIKDIKVEKLFSMNFFEA
jgi:serine/threonine-protein phosphatase 2B regulatory subunit